MFVELFLFIVLFHFIDVFAHFVKSTLNGRFIESIVSHFPEAVCGNFSRVENFEGVIGNEHGDPVDPGEKFDTVTFGLVELNAVNIVPVVVTVLVGGLTLDADEHIGEGGACEES